MLQRTAISALGRVVTALAAAIAAAGFVNCASYPSSRAGTLSGTLSAPMTKAKRSAPRATLGEIMSGAPGTYIDRLLIDRDSTVERWSDHVDRPLTIWIDSSTTLSGAQAVFPAAVRQAFEQWRSTGIALRFAFVASPRDADVRVHWTDHLEHKTGSTTWRTDRNGWLSGGDITLATHISDGEILDARGMRAIALHEVGHALGLAHSTNPQDIMAPLVHVDELSTADRATIKLLYSLNAGHPDP
ncbi:MAG: matrixin family metalloprotease [Gemmatimonadaceae bacterium]